MSLGVPEAVAKACLAEKNKVKAVCGFHAEIADSEHIDVQSQILFFSE